MQLLLPLLLAVTLSLVNTDGLNIDDNKRVNKKQRVVNGNFALIADNPFVVSIILRPWLNATTILLCGGVIIHTYWALTASHCLKPFPPKIVTSKHLFVLGNTSVWDKNILSGQHYIKKYCLHENYSGEPTDFDYDIALMKVQQPFNLIYEKPITFAGSTYQYIEYSAATVYGWGSTNVNNEDCFSSFLKSSTLFITNFQECVDDHESIGKTITSRMVCAAMAGQGSCSGDSGGPLVQSNTLIGIVSWGMMCGSEDWPGIYTRVSKFSRWILNKIHELK